MFKQLRPKWPCSLFRPLLFHCGKTLQQSLHLQLLLTSPPPYSCSCSCSCSLHRRHVTATQDTQAGRVRPPNLGNAQQGRSNDIPPQDDDDPSYGDCCRYAYTHTLQSSKTYDPSMRQIFCGAVCLLCALLREAGRIQNALGVTDSIICRRLFLISPCLALHFRRTLPWQEDPRLLPFILWAGSRCHRDECRHEWRRTRGRRHFCIPDPRLGILDGSLCQASDWGADWRGSRLLDG